MKNNEMTIKNWIEFFIDNNDLKYLGIDLARNNKEISEEWIHAQLNRYKNQGFGHLAVIQKSTGYFIGMGGGTSRIERKK